MSADTDTNPKKPAAASAQATGAASATPATLWSQATPLDPRVLAYTAGDDRDWDRTLLRWDVLGSLGHAYGLRQSGILRADEYHRLRTALRHALAAVDAGELCILPTHEDAHTAVELWLTERDADAGARLHTGRSRNDQVATDLRLYLKDALLQLHACTVHVIDALCRFAATYQAVLWPGYTHQRRAMPSTLGLWAAALAEGLLDTLESWPALFRQVDRCPLGSAAGYGAPLPMQREAAAQALGFSDLVHVVTAVQNGRGKLEGAVLGFCTQLAHDLSRLACDVCLYAAEEYGYFVLPSSLATGSSMMPHKRNPDLFELTRARAAAVDGDLSTVLLLKGKLTSGYHRDAQLLKEPLFRGVGRTREMLDMMAVAVPALGIDEARCQQAVRDGVLCTDEVLRRSEAGTPFRRAYKEVAQELQAGLSLPPPTTVEAQAQLLQRRTSTGSAGNLALHVLHARLQVCRQQAQAQRARFSAAMTALSEGDLDPLPTKDRQP